MIVNTSTGLAVASSLQPLACNQLLDMAKLVHQLPRSVHIFKDSVPPPSLPATLSRVPRNKLGSCGSIGSRHGSSFCSIFHLSIRQLLTHELELCDLHLEVQVQLHAVAMSASNSFKRRCFPGEESRLTFNVVHEVLRFLALWAFTSSALSIVS